MKLTIVIDGRSYEVEVEHTETATGRDPQPSDRAGVQSSVLPTFLKPGASAGIEEAKVCRSPLAGVVARLHTNPGQQVQDDDLLLVLDAMKMEIKITAQSAGIVKAIVVAPGEAVKPGQILVHFE